ncbi:MAG: hypothetical protein JKY88_19135 [Pseudomonadales bacterium]|nr:hypothetical protein [Pseudomonadales bacterium]
MTNEIAINYGGAQLRLEFTGNGTASLYINNIERETTSSENAIGILKLNTTVQTEYEWHEFIEGIVEYKPEEIIASLWASKSILEQLVIKRRGGNEFKYRHSND